MGQGPRIHPSSRSRRGGTRQGSGFKQRRKGNLVLACQAQQPCPACPHPTAAPCRARVPPSTSTTIPIPSLPTLRLLTPALCFFPCASSPHRFSPSPPLLLSSPPLPHPCPCPLLPSLQPGQSNPPAGSAAQQRAQPGDAGTALALLLHQKAAVEAAGPSPAQGCPVMRGAAGACILRLHPPAPSSLRHGSASAGSSPRSRPTFGCGRAGNAQSRWPCSSLTHL